jgi:periplasmic protein TonB
MVGLAGQDAVRTRGADWRRRVTLSAAMLLTVATIVWGGLSLRGGVKSPARQVAKIMLLPDTPPPPPPPEERRIEPKDELKQKVDTPKVETPPAPEPLKMEGQVGEGPSPFAAGDVKRDYIGGDPGAGVRYAAYISRLEQTIQTELARHKLKANNVKVFLWLQADGAIQRIGFDEGDVNTDRSIRVALAAIHKVDEAPAPDMPMPVGLRVSVR